MHSSSLRHFRNLLHRLLVRNQQAESGTQRTRLYFIGRPQEWRAYLELYAINNTFQVGEIVYQGTSYPAGATVYGTVEKVFPNSVLLSGVNGASGQNSNFVPGVTVTGNTGGATAKAGVWRTGSENVPTSPSILKKRNSRSSMI